MYVEMTLFNICFQIRFNPSFFILLIRMNGLCDFLESSTIHGLIYISTSKTILVRSFWVFVVVAGFLTGGYLIYQANVDWHNHPFASSEETLPISEITFPRITVCPPKGSHTALNYDLQKSELNESLRNDLRDLALEMVEDREGWEIMVDNKAFVEDNKYFNWYNGISSVAFQYEAIDFAESLLLNIATGRNNADKNFWVFISGFSSSTLASSGSFHTPWLIQPFDELLFVKNVDYKFAINIPENLENTFLVIDLMVDTKETEGGRDEIVLRRPNGWKKLIKLTGRKHLKERIAVSGLKPKPVFMNTTQCFSEMNITNLLEHFLKEVILNGINLQTPDSLKPLNPLKPDTLKPSNPFKPDTLKPSNPFRGKRDLMGFLKINPECILQSLASSAEGLVKPSLSLLIGEEAADRLLAASGEWFDEENEGAINKYEITYFRTIDPTSLYLWENKRQTGFEVSWHFEDKHGKNIDVSAKHSHNYIKKNEYFIRWINMMAKVKQFMNPGEVLEMLKRIKKNYRNEYYKVYRWTEPRFPSFKFMSVNLGGFINMALNSHQKWVNRRGSYFNSTMEKILEAVQNETLVKDVDKLNIEKGISDEDMSTWSEMFLFLFSCPPNQEISKVPIWQEFFRGLFNSSIPTRIITQTIANLIKPELRSKKETILVAETLFQRLSRGLNFKYGLLDMLLSTKQDISNREDRVQIKQINKDLKKSMMENNSIDLKDIEDTLGKVNHPVHIMDKHDNPMPSSFIPFCSISGNMSILGQKMSWFPSHPVCTVFKPKMLLGQLCYQLDMNSINGRVRLGKGERNGLVFFMDYNQERMINEVAAESGGDESEKDKNSSLSEVILKNDEATIYVDTLGELHNQ